MSWFVLDLIGQCRHLLGGHGYSTYSRLGRMYFDVDINTTWEGDNHMLLQQTTKYVLKELQKVRQKDNPLSLLNFANDVSFNLSRKSFCQRNGQKKNCSTFLITSRSIRKDCWKLKKKWQITWLSWKESEKVIWVFGISHRLSMAKKWAFCTVNYILLRWYLLHQGLYQENWQSTIRSSQGNFWELLETLDLFRPWKRKMGFYRRKKNSKGNSDRA